MSFTPAPACPPMPPVMDESYDDKLAAPVREWLEDGDFLFPLLTSGATHSAHLVNELLSFV